MDKRIIFKNTDGSIGIIVPTDCGLTVEEIARKDVPTGLSYKIVNISEKEPSSTAYLSFREICVI